MHIAQKYSHFNGEEWLLVHEKDTYEEILKVIQAVDAEKCRIEISPEKTGEEKMRYGSTGLTAEFSRLFSDLGWQSTFLSDQETEPGFSHNQTDHIKRGIGIGLQFGKYSFAAHDLFAKHLVYYTGRVINVGIEILPTKAMQREMSSGIAYYEGELHNILRHGRSNPPVPLVILGVEPGS